MLRLALQNLTVRKARTALSLLGLTVALLGIIGLISVSRGIQALMQETLARVPGITVLQKDVPALGFSNLPAALGEELEKLPGVSAVFGQVWYPAFEVEGVNLALKGDPFQLYLMLGVDVPRTKKFRDQGPVLGGLQEGRGIEGGDEILIPRAAAQRFQKKVGDTMQVLGRKLTVVGIFRAGSLFFDRCLCVPLKLAREAGGKGESLVSSFYVEVAEGADPDALSKTILERFPKTHAWTQDEVNRQTGDLWKELDLFLLAIASIAVFVGAVGIVNTMLMSVLERTSEIGVLRAVGWTRRDVVRLILLESMALGVLGGVLGCGLGGGGVLLVGTLLPLKPVATPALLLGAFTLAIALGAVGGVYPAWRASRLDPIEAIRT